MNLFLSSNQIIHLKKGHIIPLSHLELRSMIILKFRHEVYPKPKATMGVGQVNLTTPIFYASRNITGAPKEIRDKRLFLNCTKPFSISSKALLSLSSYGPVEHYFFERACYEHPYTTNPLIMQQSTN
ncbi:hypothetical protein HAX54_037545 [Datura stramonium]|uniref:Uncharacterized protein n=1 Tax=Datura stramonium TaxID=4076 RepID=A0ABS8SH14_DATST|nr:hypothetical protein [Datura stramonium]